MVGVGVALTLPPPNPCHKGLLPSQEQSKSAKSNVAVAVWFPAEFGMGLKYYIVMSFSTNFRLVFAVAHRHDTRRVLCRDVYIHIGVYRGSDNIDYLARI